MTRCGGHCGAQTSRSPSVTPRAWCSLTTRPWTSFRPRGRRRRERRTASSSTTGPPRTWSCACCSGVTAVPRDTSQPPRSQASSSDEAEYWRKAIQMQIDHKGFEEPSSAPEKASGAKAAAQASAPQQESKSDASSAPTPASAPEAKAEPPSAPASAPAPATVTAPAPAPEAKAEPAPAPAPASAPVPAPQNRDTPAPAQKPAASKQARSSVGGPLCQSLGSGPVSVEDLEAAARDALVSGVRANKVGASTAPLLC